MNRKYFAFSSLLVILTLLLAACGPTEAPPATKASEPTAAPAEATKAPEPTAAPAEATKAPEPTEPPAKSELANSLVIGVNGAPWTLDPVFSNDSWIDRHLVNAYDPLVNYKPGTNELIPWLAKEWEVSDDGLTYTFKLREGVKFHDGTDLTASDVKYTFDRILAINQGIAFELSLFDSAEVVDDYTVVLHMKAASGAFTKTLPKFYVVSEDSVKANEQNGDWGQGYLSDHDLGSGPYMLAKLEPEQEYVWGKFDGYWQDWPAGQVDTITWKIVKEAASQRLLLEKGDIDIAMEPSVDDLPALQMNPDIQILEDPSAVEMYFHLRVTHPPLDDVRVRKALAIGYDYDTHIQSVLGGYGVQARGPLPRIYPENDETIEMPTYDPDAAKALLAEAGYPNGFTMKVAYDPGSEPEKLRGFELWQVCLTKLGITVVPLAMDWPTMNSAENDETSEPDAYVEFMWPSALDPDESLRAVYHSSMLGNGSNASWYSNPEVDKLMDQALGMSDPVERTKMYKQIQQIINDDQPSIFVSNPDYFIAARTWVKGYVYNPSHHQAVLLWGMSIEGKP